MSDMRGHYDGEPVGRLHHDDAARLRSILAADSEPSERAATARQQARYAIEDAVRCARLGRINLARQSLEDALALFDQADAIEDGNDG